MLLQINGEINVGHAAVAKSGPAGQMSYLLDVVSCCRSTKNLETKDSSLSSEWIVIVNEAKVQS